MVVLMAVSAKDNDTYPIDNQAKKGYKDGLVENDFHRAEHPAGAFPRHEQGKKCQQQCPAEAAQGVNLSRSETISGIGRVLSRIDICEGVYAQCCRV
ncbi:MAG: hypothetical protein BWY09_02132 [Candidatus Hydrogenedentes bacterium ADurb.Bin179]|nr:MAG: hypothetical protein BWY09_02132 [Candidatus Hydrogenedentes bacterium ADurb.Bin179]